MTREDEKFIRAELEATGLPHTIEKCRKHLKLRLCGHQVAIVPFSPNTSSRQALMNVRAQIRRFAKEYTA